MIDRALVSPAAVYADCLAARHIARDLTVSTLCQHNHRRVSLFASHAESREQVAYLTRARCSTAPPDRVGGAAEHTQAGAARAVGCVCTLVQAVGPECGMLGGTGPVSCVHQKRIRARAALCIYYYAIINAAGRWASCVRHAAVTNTGETGRCKVRLALCMYLDVCTHFARTT